MAWIKALFDAEAPSVHFMDRWFYFWIRRVFSSSEREQAEATARAVLRTWADARDGAPFERFQRSPLYPMTRAQWLPWLDGAQRSLTPDARAGDDLVCLGRVAGTIRTHGSSTAATSPIPPCRGASAAVFRVRVISAARK